MLTRLLGTVVLLPPRSWSRCDRSNDRGTDRSNTARSFPRRCP
jgi:hypothetical protein